MMREPTAPSPRNAPRWLPWLVVLAGFALDIAAYWPGQMSFDSAYAWWQARGGETTNITPPLIVFVWRACDALLSGPGLIFALHLLMFWSGLALLARAARLGAWRTLALVLCAAFAPVPWLLRGHVWTDVGLLSALAFAAGALAFAQATRHRRWLVVALPALFYATAIRFNAAPAVLPFALWAAWLAFGKTPTGASRRLPIMAAAAILWLGLIGAAMTVDAQVQRRVPLWTVVATWDLAALSIASNQMLLPAFMTGPGLDVPELAAASRDWSVTPLLQGTRHGVRDPFMGEWSPAELRALRAAWFEAIRAHPRAWSAHVWRRAGALLGTHDPAWPRELLYVDDEVRYRDNPPIRRNQSLLHRILMRGAAALSETPLLAAWPYLLLGLTAVPRARQRWHVNADPLALALLASAALYLLPLPLLVPAELRYLGWPCLACLLAFAWCRFAPREALIDFAQASSRGRT
ncbi:MAG: hypothetical protein ACHP7D_12450 [Lysobacterales bacterium]